jgi:hypothetical protein
MACRSLSGLARVETMKPYSRNLETASNRFCSDSVANPGRSPANEMRDDCN